MWRLKTLAVLAVCLAFPVAASAFSVTWTFSVPNDDVGSPNHTYISDGPGVNLPASSWRTTNTSPLNASIGDTWVTGITTNTPNLWGKHEGADETGLGQKGINADNEIEETSFVQLDVTDLFAKHYVDLTMGVGSIQQGEGFYLWGSDTLGVPGQLLLIGTNPSGLAGLVTQTFSVPDFGQYDYYSVSSISHPGPLAGSTASSDVLIVDGATATLVPEPATITLLGLGLSGLAGMIRRRKK